MNYFTQTDHMGVNKSYCIFNSSVNNFYLLIILNHRLILPYGNMGLDKIQYLKFLLLFRKKLFEQFS